MKKITYFLLFLSFCLITNNLSAQDKERVGVNQFYSQQGGFFNYGDKEKVNIEVSVWGYVKYPGKYVVPLGSSVVDLISYAGGPVVDANLEDIRLFRPKNDTLEVSAEEMVKLNYDDIFWADKIKSTKNRNFILKPGDILVFPGEPRLFFKDNFTLVLSAASVLLSLTILIVSIANKN